MMRRDPLRLFAEPVPQSIVDYHKIVQKPMDFNTMRQKVAEGQYTSFGSFVSDARLLCSNALFFNPPGSVYWNTAKELQGALESMQKRASAWMMAIKGAHSSHFTRSRTGQISSSNNKSNGIGTASDTDAAASPCNENNHTNGDDNDPFRELRVRWPGAAEWLESSSDWLMAQIKADFMRTKENEIAYYGALVVQRVAAAAGAALAPTPDAGGVHQPCIRRDYEGDEQMRCHMDEAVSKINGPVQLKEESGFREEGVLRLLRRVQKRRVERRTSSESGCARCDGTRNDEETKLAMTAEAIRMRRKRDNEKPRVVKSRLRYSTGLASAVARKRIENETTAKGVVSDDNDNDKNDNDGEHQTKDITTTTTASNNTTTAEALGLTARDKSVSVRGSRIHGWGLFADHPFQKGEVVAEYVGEYVGIPVADEREKFYEERRIQDYQFRVSGDLVIDATMKGGHARYINHSCDPNCVAKIIPGDAPNEHLKRVMIISQRYIHAREEITYDYQFPLEQDLNARIPCHCASTKCRGFMNWDLPEFGSRTAQHQIRGSGGGRGKGRLKKSKSNGNNSSSSSSNNKKLKRGDSSSKNN